VAGEFGTDALIQHWKRQREDATRVVMTSTVTSEVITISDSAQVELTGHAPTVVVSLPEVLFSALVEKGDRTGEGDLIIAVTPVFRRFLRELERDPNALYKLDSRQFEELIAGAYNEDGCHVVLTPRSGDGGRDVIATRSDFGTIRVLDQVKLYRPHRVVEADDVRALYGVLGNDLGASKGIVTTTSRFAPGVYKEFERQIPGRITLRDGEQLRDWLHRINKS